MHGLSVTQWPQKFLAGSDEARREVRLSLGLDLNDIILAVLPGSRGSEVELMLRPMLQAAQGFAEAQPTSNRSVRVIIPCVNQARYAQVDPIAKNLVS